MHLCDPTVELIRSVPTHHSPFFCCNFRLAAFNLKAWTTASTRYMITTVPNHSAIPVYDSADALYKVSMLHSPSNKYASHDATHSPLSESPMVVVCCQ
jgi:hypothetical protein